jgi:uncharacterized protein (TIGR02145 family)
LPSGARSILTIKGQNTRKYISEYGHIEKSAYWWTASEFDTNSAWIRFLENFGDHIYRSDWKKNCGFSVRIVKD